MMQPQVFIQFMVQEMGITFSDKELYCLLHILVRESDSANPSNGATEATASAA